MEKYLEKFGSNFFVAALIPSLTFIVICIAVFLPLFPVNIQNQWKLPITFGQFSQISLIVLLMGIIVSFTVSSLNTFILKVYEGYIFIEHFPWLITSERRRARKIQKKLTFLKKKFDRLNESSDNCQDEPLRERYDSLIQKTSQEIQDLAVYYQNSFPNNPTQILPTKFGNILKSAEYYSLDRYGMDSVILWPRLLYVIDPKYSDLIDESNNELSFLVNCSFLSLIFSILTIPACSFVLLTGKENFLYYPALGAIGLFVSIIFHRASLVSLNQYGDMIRSAYDLFRFKLIKALGLPVKEDLINERAQWEAICEFMKIGDYAGPMNFSYKVSSEGEKVNGPDKTLE